MDRVTRLTSRLQPICLLVLAVLLLAPLPEIVPSAGAATRTLTVNNDGDSGAGGCDGTECTLREAITAANDHAGADTVAFNIPGSGPHTLKLSADLPTITDTVTIDGYSEPDAVGKENTIASAINGTNADPQIVLDGSGGITIGLEIDGKNSVIKGLVFNNFTQFGLLVQAPGVKIEGNFIGTAQTGTAAASSGDGVGILAPNVTIGGTKPELRNLISGNPTRGVNIEAANTVIQGNLIGPNKTITADLGNGVGVQFSSNEAGNALIGGTTAAAANVIAFNGRGIGTFLNITGNGNRILRNTIVLNDALGIDLGSDGVTPNDDKDPDPGPNRLQNFPVLDTATLAGGELTIVGTLNSKPESTFTIQFFATPPGQGSDEGKLFLGQKKVTTNRNGNATINVTFTPAAPVSAGDLITATATNKKKKDTSEFSAAIAVT